ncbi:hypothetical protein EGW08_017074 [Elysia chlorotica]|uniref:G-protein coupled receptors family 1 profile domain-containing protein n=1 Tax=Elysia chlorotica TaxID=188477 RepID=A0A433T0U0_ELYCH|nr:hypothetical protein EGW08_017074 [Elysia chlorotica]
MTYILCLALTDLVSCLFRNPGYIMEHQGVWLRYSTSDLCKVISWLSQTTVCVSIFIFALIAIDRYLKLCSASGYSRYSLSPRHSRNAILVLVALTLVMAAPCLFLFENTGRGVCLMTPQTLHRPLVKAYYSAIFALFLIMMIAVAFCYISIAFAVSDFDQIRRERRVLSEALVPKVTFQTAAGEADNPPGEADHTPLSPPQGVGRPVLTFHQQPRTGRRQDTLRVHPESSPPQGVGRPVLTFHQQPRTGRRQDTLRVHPESAPVGLSKANTPQNKNTHHDSSPILILSPAFLPHDLNLEGPVLDGDPALPYTHANVGQKQSPGTSRGQPTPPKDNGTGCPAWTEPVSTCSEPVPLETVALGPSALSVAPNPLAVQKRPVPLTDSVGRGEEITVVEKHHGQGETSCPMENSSPAPTACKSPKDSLGSASHSETYATGLRNLDHSIIQLGLVRCDSSTYRSSSGTCDSSTYRSSSGTCDSSTSRSGSSNPNTDTTNSGSTQSSSPSRCQGEYGIPEHQSDTKARAWSKPLADQVGLALRLGPAQTAGGGGDKERRVVTRAENVPGRGDGGQQETATWSRRATRVTSRENTVTTSATAAPQGGLHILGLRRRRNTRVTGLLFSVTVVFILSWVPPYVALIKGLYVGYAWPISAAQFTLLTYGPNVYVINTFANPIIYAVASATYRRHVTDFAMAVKSAVRRLVCRS